MTTSLGHDEVHRRRALALRLGGVDQVARQHAQGKLTARERIDLLADLGSLREFGILTGRSEYSPEGELRDFVPKGQVDGIVEIEARPAVVSAGDFTVRGGAGGVDAVGFGREPLPAERALEMGVPLIRLLDASGGSVKSFLDLGRTYPPDGNTFVAPEVELLQLAPVVSAVMGPVAGLPAVAACLGHFNVMVKETSQLFPGGPPVVKAALGLDITKEELGGWRVHVHESGSVNNVAVDEHDALAQVRAFLSYLPTNVHTMPPRSAPRGPGTDPDTLRDVIPEDARTPFDPRAVIDAVVDEATFFELSPAYGGSRVTGLARVDGFPVGIMANDPAVLGGSTDTAAAMKTIRLIQICDQFHLPLVSLADEPGVLVGPDSERAGIEAAGARLVWSVCRSRMPWMTVVMGRLFGVGGQTHHRASGMFRRIAWPTAQWGSMHISGGTYAAFRSQIESAPDPEAEQARIEAQLRAVTSPFRTAEATGQDIVDPAETRDLVVQFVRDAQLPLARQLGPSPTPFLP
ncbi:hypothetical protein IDH50_07455 [Aeromicrobium tamlense]|uniref:Acetyl-CoA carboxylase carboxyltransferase component n=1 Tax=Aeromicrobium tamlense TaxID=375541 RepID=A0A8I0FW52_9ACTN|nr:carboxyl transferase domain-containing protein [Aeromicrobium tamlense]MBD1270061.1 hypothetical protein [Aeromicrobium tamlense]NYI39281.1 acetyl-CoA carboxylase carboxyltransferase component [Aeromicrobium tamlense]